MNNEIRKIIKDKRANLSKEAVAKLSDEIFKNLNLLEEIKTYNNFFVYNSFKGEVDTKKIISLLKENGKVVAFPITVDNTMVAGVPTSTENVLDNFGISIPKQYLVLDDIDVAIVPLIATDKNKNRLGFGKGFYDKFLSKHTCIKIGICYEFQIVENLQVNDWDVPLDIIVTEKRIIR